MCTSFSGAALDAAEEVCSTHRSEPSNPPSVLLGASIVQACRHLFLQHLGWWEPLENLMGMATPLRTPVKATLMWAAFCKASFFPFPSSFCLLCSRSHHAENEPKIVSNHLHPSLDLSLYSMSISAGTEQDEILSSVVWRRISPFFSWLKWFLWLYPELGSTAGLSSDTAFSFLDYLGSYPPPCIPSKSSFLLHHVDIQTVSCIQDSRRTGESAWGDTWTLLCSSLFLQAALQKYAIVLWLQSLFTTNQRTASINRREFSVLLNHLH